MLNCIVVALVLTGQGQYQGADAVLARMKMPTIGSSLSDPNVVLASDIATYEGHSAAMAPEAAASSWLELARRSINLAENKRKYSSQNFMKALVGALPAPEVWPVIERQLADFDPNHPQSDVGLRLLLTVLQNKPVGPEFDAYLQGDPDSKNDYRQRELRMEIALRNKDADAVEAEVLRRSNNDAFASTSRTASWSYSIPDIVPLLGEARASRLFETVLLKSPGELTFEGQRGTPTVKLATKIAVANLDRLAGPQWTIASTREAGGMFTTLAANFKQRPMRMTSSLPSATSYNNAALAGLINLFEVGRTTEAAQLAEKYKDDFDVGWGTEDTLVQGPKRRAFLELIKPLALKYPQSRLSSVYFFFAKSGDDPKEAVFVKELTKRDPSDYRKDWQARREVDRAFALGDLPRLARLLKEKSYDSYEHEGRASVYWILGKQLHRPDLEKIAIHRFVTDMEGSYWSDDQPELLAEALRRGMGPVVEKVLIANLREAMSTRGTGSPPITRSAGEDLANFYFAVGRYSDYVTLLDKYPGWAATDVSYLNSGIELYRVAKSLAMVGRKSEARRIVRQSLLLDCDNQALQLLVDIDPDADAFLRELATVWPNHPGPFTWRAVGLRRKGQNGEAARLAARALELDPLDTVSIEKEGRFKALELSKTSKAAAAEVAKARRHFEAATRYADAQFASLAALEYRKELALIPDDFPARIRLAIALYTMGRPEEGAKEIRVACKSVPARAISGYYYYDVLPGELYQFPRAKEELRKNLEQQVAAGSANSVSYWLLAVLANPLEESGEVARYAKMAVELDPDNRAAWDILTSANSDPKAPEIANSIRLMWPDQYEVPGVLSSGNFAETWRSALAIAKRFRKVDDLYPLPASRQYLQSHWYRDFVDERAEKVWNPSNLAPGRILASDPVISALCDVIEEQVKGTDDDF